MTPEILFPDDFDDYAWEVQSKGVFTDVPVRVAGILHSVTFYDLARLIQDVQDQLVEEQQSDLRSVLVVPSVTAEAMKNAVARVGAAFFE